MNRLLTIVGVLYLLPGCTQQALPQATPTPPVAAPPRAEPSLRTVQALIDEEKGKLERLRGETAFLEEALSAKKRALDEREKDQATPPASSTEKPLRVVVEPGAWRATGLILQPGLRYAIHAVSWDGESPPELYFGTRYGRVIKGFKDPLPANQLTSGVGPLLFTEDIPGELMLRAEGGAVEVEVLPGIPRVSVAHTITDTHRSEEPLAEL